MFHVTWLFSCCLPLQFSVTCTCWSPWWINGFITLYIYYSSFRVIDQLVHHLDQVTEPRARPTEPHDQVRVWWSWPSDSTCPDQANAPRTDSNPTRLKHFLIWASHFATVLAILLQYSVILWFCQIFLRFCSVIWYGENNHFAVMIRHFIILSDILKIFAQVG
jgi:hypothetical protein